MTAQNLQPFIASLGRDLERASPLVRAHLSQRSGTRVYEGWMKQLQGRGVVGRVMARCLRLGTWQDVLSPTSAQGRPFKLVHTIVDHDGTIGMIWDRTLYLQRATVQIAGLMVFDADKQILVDSIGKRRTLKVELAARVEERRVIMKSRRQWIRVLGLTVRLPRWLCGGASIAEWETREGTIGLQLTLHHPMLGPYLTYEVELQPDAE